MANYYGGEFITTSITGQSTGGTLTLLSPGPGKNTALYSVMVRAPGTITSTQVQVNTTSGSANIAYWGSDSTIPNGGVWTFPIPIVGLKNDAMVITVTVSGATASQVAIAATYKFVQA